MNDAQMAERLQSQINGGGGAPSSAQSDADAALARQLQTEINGPAGSASGAASTAGSAEAQLMHTFSVTPVRGTIPQTRVLLACAAARAVFTSRTVQRARGTRVTALRHSASC